MTNNDAAAHGQLGMLVGRWRSDGHLVADPSIKIRGTDTYASLPGGRCLVHYVDVMVGETPVQAIELITPGPHENTFTARAYDNAGMITMMHAQVDQNGAWTFTGGPEVAAAAQPDNASPTGAVRSTLTISDHRQSMHADWERTDNGSSWQPWMIMEFTFDHDLPVTEESAYQSAAWADGPAVSALHELQRLAPLAGRWRATGSSSRGDFDIAGQTDLRWLSGGRFLVGRSALESASVTNYSLVLIGWDEQRSDCLADYIDSDGAQASYRLGLSGNELTIDSPEVRFAGRFDQSSNAITGTWESSPDGSSWQYWYDAESLRLPSR